MAGVEFDHVAVADALRPDHELVHERLDGLARRRLWVRGIGAFSMADGRTPRRDYAFGHALFRHVFARRPGGSCGETDSSSFGRVPRTQPWRPRSRDGRCDRVARRTRWRCGARHRTLCRRGPIGAATSGARAGAGTDLTRPRPGQVDAANPRHGRGVAAGVHAPRRIDGDARVCRRRSSSDGGARAIDRRWHAD